MSEFREELKLYATWYNNFRPHDTLKGRTPVEVFEGRPAANQFPRFEPRKRWPKDSPCAAPQAPLRPDAHAELRLEVAYLEGRKHLPIVRLRPAA